MTLRPFERYRTINRTNEQDFELLQDHLEDTLGKLTDQPGNDTILYESVALTSGSQNLLEHGLGRAVRGWRVVDIDNSAQVYRYFNSTEDLALYLPLGCTANCTVSLEVF